MQEAIKRGFARIEEDWLNVAKVTFEKGFAQPAYASSTALVAIVSDGKLFVANSGDSKAVLLRKRADRDEFEQISLNQIHSINKKSEQARLKKSFPGETDIFHCMKQPNGRQECFTKGSLQPTRSFGDFRLKHREFNFHQFREENGYRLPIPMFSGPYISAEPQIQVFQLSKEDKFVVLATDGLWKNVGRKETSAIVTQALSRDSSQSANEDLAKLDAPGQKIVKR